MNAIGLGLGLSYYKPQPPFDLASLGNKELLIDARTIAGSNGDPLATIADASGNGYDFTQAVGASKPTLSTSWAGSQAVAFSGSQFASCANPVLNGITAFSICWVGQFSSVAGIRVPFYFGNNAAPDGFDFNSNRNSTGKFGVFVRGAAAVDSGTASDTAAHLVVITYDAAGTPRWTMTIDGAAQTLSNSNTEPFTPTTRAVIGATDTVPNFGFAGSMGLLVVCSDVWPASVVSSITANAKRSWTLP